MSYPKVKDFLSHLVTGTKVLIKDDINENLVYFEGTVSDYFNADISLEDLTLIQSFIRDNTLIIPALKDYTPNQIKERSSMNNVYIVRFQGRHLGGEMVIVDETARKALNRAKKELESLNLLAKNEALSLSDVTEIKTDKKAVIVLDDGDY